MSHSVAEKKDSDAQRTWGNKKITMYKSRMHTTQIIGTPKKNSEIKKEKCNPSCGLVLGSWGDGGTGKSSTTVDHRHSGCQGAACDAEEKGKLTKKSVPLGNEDQCGGE